MKMAPRFNIETEEWGNGNESVSVTLDGAQGSLSFFPNGVAADHNGFARLHCRNNWAILRIVSWFDQECRRRGVHRVELGLTGEGRRLVEAVCLRHSWAVTKGELGGWVLCRLETHEEGSNHQ